MDRIQDDALLRRQLQGQEFARCFDPLPADLELRRYYKGEFLSTPLRPQKFFCLILQGHIRIYGVREDGSGFSVSAGGSGDLLGDMEFCRVDHMPLYVEVVDEVLCVLLPMEPHRAELEQNPRFLRLVMRSLAGKVMMSSRLDLAAQSLEARLIAFLRDIQPDHMLHSINEGITRLHCSRSQLQRVVSKLCMDGVLCKTGKGRYHLADTASGQDL